MGNDISTKARRRPVWLELTENELILGSVLSLVLFSSVPFLSGVLRVCSSSPYDGFGFAVIGLHFVTYSAVLLSASCFRLITKPLLIVFFLASSVVVFTLNYAPLPFNSLTVLEFVDVIKAPNAKELVPEFLILVVSLGVVPAFCVAQANTVWRGWPMELRARAKLIALIVVVFWIPAIVLEQKGAVEIDRTLGYGATLKDSMQPLLKCLVSP